MTGDPPRATRQPLPPEPTGPGPTQPNPTWAVAGEQLADLLRASRESFLHVFRTRELSQTYLNQATFIIDEYAQFCEQREAAHPWLLRRDYLAKRAELRSQQPFSHSYLKAHSRELRGFLRWYLARVDAGKVSRGELSPTQLRGYWSTQRGASQYRRQLLAGHLEPLLRWLQHHPFAVSNGELASQVRDYLEQRRLAKRGKGWGYVLTHRAEIVTRGHLVWLEQRGQLPAGTAAGAGVQPDTADTASISAGDTGGHLAEHDPAGLRSMLDHFVAKVDCDLPQGLRRPLTAYLEHLVYERKLVKGSLKASLRINLTLCRHLAHLGHDSYVRLCVIHLDEVVSRLVSAPSDDLRRRRQQVRGHQSRLRGFLRYLDQRGLLERDLAATLISPPCYRSSRPVVVLSEEQVRGLLDSVDRCCAHGRRCYAALMLMTTYGLRPGDVAQLRLDDMHWREQRIAIVQKKTGRVVALPLLAEVAVALHDYLRHDRPPGLPWREVFVSLVWPHRPVRSAAISKTVAKALASCGLGWARAKDLRASVATHLLRQGEAFSTIQEVLGHRTAETTQRYAVTDLELLREVLEEKER